jgi:probable rRNA maturation factor
MKLLFLNQSRDRVSKAWLERWVKGLSTILKKQGLTPQNKSSAKFSRQELVVVLTTSAEIRKLNHLYRHKDKATDILSFEASDPDTVGELVICMPVIRKQAKSTGLSVSGELGYMVVHGVLHLFGFDHEDESQAKEMFALQDQIYADLKKLVGLAPNIGSSPRELP